MLLGLVLYTAASPASFCLPVPNDNALLFQTVPAQGLMLATAGCLTATDAIVVTIQPR